MNRKDLAIEKITKECQGKKYLVPIEEYLTSICNTKVAEKILAEGKSLAACFESMRKIAKKRAVNGCAYIPPEEGFSIIRKYYDISDSDLSSHSNVIDITELI